VHSAASSATPACAWSRGGGGGGGEVGGEEDEDDDEDDEELEVELELEASPFATSSTGHTLVSACPSLIGSDFLVPAQARPRKAMTRPPLEPALSSLSSQTKTREKKDSPRSSTSS
jgi:hypothetical protein